MSTQQAQVLDNKVVEAQVQAANAASDDANPFAMLDAAPAAEDRSADAIAKALVARGLGRVAKGLQVRNAVVHVDERSTYVTFVVKEKVLGTVTEDSTDPFGAPTRSIGLTHNVQVGLFALIGAMKDDARLATFAAQVAEQPQLVVELFVGGQLDLLMEFVPEGVAYRNPFSSSNDERTFERDMVLHHVLGLRLGTVGEDVYKAKLAAMASRF